MAQAQEELQLRKWEQAEIKRSALEAALTHGEDLRASERTLTRYQAPPADTCYSLEYAFHLLGDVRGKVVLDLGCGSGENTILLTRRGARVHATDISSSLIAIARRRLEVNGIGEKPNFFAGSAHEFPLPDESVDVVFGMAILHHLDLKLAAREVRRILRPGGRAIFQEPVRNSKLLKFVRSLIPYRAPDVSPFERPLTDEELAEFAQGYRSFSCKAFALPYLGLAEILPVARNYMEQLHHYDFKVLRRFPALEYYASIRVIEMVK
jgi:ubiquinone/menaquinone biosynthesis C-methylase UbiE